MGLALRAPAALLAACSAQNAVLLVASLRRLSPPPPSPQPRQLAVLVPAHDEEPVIHATVRSLEEQDLDGARRETIVIADNCTDRTAEIAASAGATVWERQAPDARGKGQALAWALDRLDRERPDAEAIVCVDADCRADPGLLTALEARLGRARAVQADYVVSNPEASTQSALRFAGFALINSVRPRGKRALGLSAGLNGSGMAFDRALLREHPWNAFSIVEDAEYHLRLLLAGEVTDFAPEATVRSEMPTTTDASGPQQSRWETGRVLMFRAWAGPLLRAGLRRRDPRCLHAAFEQVVPPQSILLSGLGLVGLAGTAARDRTTVRLATVGVAAQVAYVVGGLARVGAPPAVWRALAHAPALVAAKLALYVKILSGSGSSAWQRTQRGG